MRSEVNASDRKGSFSLLQVALYRPILFTSYLFTEGRINEKAAGVETANVAVPLDTEDLSSPGCNCNTTASNKQRSL